MSATSPHRAPEMAERSAVALLMPELGEGGSKGAVTRWLKKEGERVTMDEPLIEVSTDEVGIVIPFPLSGILRGITVAEDETVAAGASLAIIEADPDIEHGRNLAVDTGGARPSDARRQRGTGRVAPWAAHLLSAAARLLPAGDRARYGEEFRSDLWELAAAGAGRRQQICCSLRQLLHAIPLRMAVLSPRRKNAAP